MRLRCHLFGCCQYEDMPVCYRCGCYLDSPESIDHGYLSWLLRLWYHDWRTEGRCRWTRFVRWLRPTCLHCGKRLRGSAVGVGFCSRECCESSLPF